MRREDKRISDPGELEAVFAEGEVCRLGLADDGTPYVVPLSFVYSAGESAAEPGVLYFHSAPAGRKLDIIDRSPRACFEVSVYGGTVGADRPCGCTSAYRSVIGYGKVAVVTAESEKRRALEMLGERYVGSGELNDAQVDACVVLRLDIDELTGKKSG